MTRIKRSRSGEKQSWDVEEAIRKRKRRKFLEFLEIKTTKKLRSPKAVKREGGEPGGKECLPTPKEEKPVKKDQPCQTVSFTLHDDGRVSQDFCRQNGSRIQQDGRGTRSGIRNFCRGPIIRSSVKADCISKENSSDNPIILSDDGSKLNENDLSVKAITETIKPSSRTWSSLRRQSTRSSTKAASTGRISACQSRVRLCSICNKSFPNFSTVSGSNLSLCSVCRRKSKAVDIASPLDIDFQAHTAKSPRSGRQQHNNMRAGDIAGKTPGSGRKQQNNMRDGDIAGKTPDTAVKIDSSDDEEEAVNGSRSAINSRERLQSDLQRPVKRIAYPSRTELEAIEILDSDVENLEPSEYLNDTIIDFYIKYIQREFLSQERDSRFHFFNSFFYKKLSGVAGKKKKKKVPDFTKLRKWTKGINIFEKDYLIIPVHDKLHWSLAIICFPNHGPGSSSRSERCILHLDSMVCGHQSLTIFRLLRRYLVAEWKYTFGEAKMKGDGIIHTLTCNVIPGKQVPVPLQENESDCGLFILHYIRKFVENAPKTMKISDVEDRLEDLGVFGREWFSPVEASNLRTSIQKILRSLFAKNGVVLDKSRDISFEINDNVKPRNLETEFRIYL